MSLQGRIQTTTLEKRDAPSMSIKVLALRQLPNGNHALAPLREDDAERFGLRRLSTQRVEFGMSTGKSRTFLIQPQTDLRLLVKMAFVRKGHTQLWTLAFRSRPEDSHGRVLIPCAGSYVTALSGPLLRLHPEQARVCFGAGYKPATDLTEVARLRYKIQVNGVSKAVTPSIISTVDEEGTATTVSIRRRPRQTG